MDIKSLADVVGGTKATLDLTSDCVNGQRANVIVGLIGPQVGIGLKFLFGGQTKANVSFEDHQNEIDVNNLVGFAGIVSAGFQIGTLGFGGSKIRIGNAFS
jgi:hypothetical protein